MFCGMNRGILTRHIKGINVAYANGAVKWVPLDASRGTTVLQKEIQTMTRPDGAFSTGFNGNVGNIWKILDAQ
jgi:hypothetical protein